MQKSLKKRLHKKRNQQFINPLNMMMNQKSFYPYFEELLLDSLQWLNKKLKRSFNL